MNDEGWRIFSSPVVADHALIESLKKVPVSVISDCLERMTGTVGLTAFHGHGRLAGTAVTVKVRAGDNLMIYRALGMCSPGHVLVIDGGGDLSRAVIGEIIVRLSQTAGVAGIVLDGAIRDVEQIRQGDFPVFARGINHRGPYKNGPGEVNVPVSIGGMVVNPGDVIVADENGVLAMPQSIATRTVAAAQKIVEKEAEIIAQIEHGIYDMGWVAARIDEMRK